MIGQRQSLGMTMLALAWAAGCSISDAVVSVSQEAGSTGAAAGASGMIAANTGGATTSSGGSSNGGRSSGGATSSAGGSVARDAAPDGADSSAGGTTGDSGAGGTGTGGAGTGGGGKDAAAGAGGLGTGGLVGSGGQSSGGTAGAGGTAGTGGSPNVCNPTCSGTTPTCVQGSCRACRSDADCSGATPACEPSGACGQCSATNHAKCTGATPVCLGSTCVACTPDEPRCSTGTQPQKCNSTGQWVNQSACTSAVAPNCVGGACTCTGLVCGSKCVNSDTDVANCGDCGHQCSTANASATRACSSGQCAPACQSGFQNCNTPLAPNADDGCECAGTGCCGSGCQTKHNNGNIVGPGFQDFWSCDPTSGATAAMDACLTYIAANPVINTRPVAGCSDQQPAGYAIVCSYTYAGTTSCPYYDIDGNCWGYGGFAAQNVYGPVSAGAGCAATVPTACRNGACVYDGEVPIGQWH